MSGVLPSGRMDRTLAIALVTTLLLACASDDHAPREKSSEVTERPAPATDLDAGVSATSAPVPLDAPGIADYGVAQPLQRSEPTGSAYRPPRARARTLELILRSTPPGAEASVDGKSIGLTPTFWRGKMTGKRREFTFVLRDYAVARYRFVPTTNGVVHASLQPLTTDEPDAGPGQR